MTRLARWFLMASLLPALLAVWTMSAPAKDFFPLPEFGNHPIPSAEHPVPEGTGHDVLGVAALVAALALASFLALKTRSRRGLYLLAIASLAFFGFAREGCICPIGAIQNVTLAIFDSSYAIPWTVAAMLALPMIFTLFFGRTFCASVCPLGAIQEITAVYPVKVPRWLDQALGLVAFVYLGLAAVLSASGAAFLICRYDPFVGLFRRNAPLEMFILGGCFLVVGLFVGRPYCRYLCPLGAILGLLSKVSGRHVRIPPQECINCRLCEDVCPYGAIEEPTAAPAQLERQRGRRRLGWMLLLLPVLVAGGAVGGRWLGPPLAKFHPRVRLAERIRSDELAPPTAVTVADPSKPVDAEEKRMTDAVEQFYSTGGKKEDLYREVFDMQHAFAVAAMALGGWIGLVVGVKLIALSTRRRRSNYRPDPGKCVSCGRCFWYCPEEQLRLGLIREADLLSTSEKSAQEAT